MDDEQQVFDGMDMPEGASPEYVRVIIESMRATLAAARHNTRILQGKES